MKPNKFTQKISTIILWLLFVVVIFLFLATFTNLNRILVGPLVRDETPQKADAVIVLGGGVVTDLKILPWGAQERVQRGVELYKQGYVDKVIVTGGLVKGHDYTESDIMAPYTEFLGVAKEDIFKEDKAEDTRGNATYSLEIMQENSWEKVLLVTSDFHTQRACHVFEKLNIDITCLAAYKNPGFEGNYFRNLTDFIVIGREYLATVYYFMRGYI